MSDLLNIVAPFFSTARDYSQVLKRLAAAVFWEVYFVTFYLRDIPQVDERFKTVETYGSLGKLISAIPNSDSLNISGFVIALFIARFCYEIQLHDRISDLLGIRRRFDVEEILLPLTELITLKLSPAQVEALRHNRHRVMSEVFYKYTSSRLDTPIVDKHLIEHALSAWSSYWMSIEGIIVCLVMAVVAYIFNALQLTAALMIAVILIYSISCLQFSRLKHHARAQIQAIASDPTASAAIRIRFNAL